MRKTVFVITSLIMLSACGSKQVQTESADTAAVAKSTETMPQFRSYSLNGTIGEDQASIVLGRNGNAVSGVVVRCDFCEPFNVEGTWQGGTIKVEGFTQAGSHVKYELAVTGNAVQGMEVLSAEGEVEEQDVTMMVE